MDETEYTDMSEVATLLKKCNNCSAPGPDKIRYRTNTWKLLHKKHPWILATIFNDCLELCHFPKQWKEGIAVFIPKPGKPANETDSYRPLSLLNCMGKLFEQIIKRRLEIRLSNNQYGFHKGRSTEQCIQGVIDTIQHLNENKYFVAAISLDIKGVFDHL